MYHIFLVAPRERGYKLLGHNPDVKTENTHWSDGRAHATSDAPNVQQTRITLWENYTLAEHLLCLSHLILFFSICHHSKAFFFSCLFLHFRWTSQRDLGRVRGQVRAPMTFSSANLKGRSGSKPTDWRWKARGRWQWRHSHEQWKQPVDRARVRHRPVRGRQPVDEVKVGQTQ